MTLRNVIRRLKGITFRYRIAQQGSAPGAAKEQPAPMHSKLAENMEILAHGYGQLRTFDIHRPVDNLGDALPWFTYPAIEYLKRFNCTGWRVFEYGVGQSTAYWSRRGAIVTSVEHDEKWFTEMKEKIPPHATINHRNEKVSYVNAINEANTRFNAIVIDGVWREACAEVCIPFLRDDGILILDNSDWYHQAGTMIRKQGFLEVSFSGFGPVNGYTWTTSMFFKTANHLYDLAEPEPIGGNVLGPDAVDELW